MASMTAPPSSDSLLLFVHRFTASGRPRWERDKLQEDPGSIQMTTLFCLLALVASASTSSVAGEVFPTVLETFDYPVLGVQAQLAGDVELDATIAATGSVKQTKVVSGHRVLADAAESAIKSWRFAHRCPGGPASEETIVRFHFTFRLQGVAEGRPRTKLTYIFPNRIIVAGEAVHYQPAR